MKSVSIQFSTYKEMCNQKPCPDIIIFKMWINLLVHEFKFKRQEQKFIQIQVIKDMNLQVAGIVKNIARVAKFVNSVSMSSIF